MEVIKMTKTVKRRDSSPLKWPIIIVVLGIIYLVLAYFAPLPPFG